MEAEDTPYIEPGDELDDDPQKNGPNCFINDMRVCGADCMAYSTFLVKDRDLGLSEEQKHCSVLVGISRVGLYSGGLLSQLKKNSADERRTSAVPVPDPKRG